MIAQIVVGTGNYRRVFIRERNSAMSADLTRRICYHLGIKDQRSHTKAAKAHKPLLNRPVDFRVKAVA